MNALNIDNLNPIITASCVAINRRYRMQPKYFKQYFMKTENRIFTLLEMIAPDYTGGYWEFYELSNGGFYMAPKPANGGTFNIQIPFGNNYQGQMSADATGILTCVFAYGWMAEHTQDDVFFNLHSKLVDFLYSHPEADQLCRALD